MSLHNRFWALADLGDESTDEDDGNDPFEDEKGETFGCDGDGAYAYGFMGFNELSQSYGKTSK